MKVTIEITHEGQTFSGQLELPPSAGSGKAPTKPLRSDKVPVAPIKKPSAALQLLYRKNFFREAHNLAEVWNELRKEGYNFSRPAVLMALQAAEFLTMTGKRGSYRFVQKFPPVT